jgi:hypothetical protein
VHRCQCLQGTVRVQERDQCLQGSELLQGQGVPRIDPQGMRRREGEDAGPRRLNGGFCRMKFPSRRLIEWPQRWPETSAGWRRSSLVSQPAGNGSPRAVTAVREVHARRLVLVALELYASSAGCSSANGWHPTGSAASRAARSPLPTRVAITSEFIERPARRDLRSYCLRRSGLHRVPACRARRRWDNFGTLRS